MTNLIKQLVEAVGTIKGRGFVREVLRRTLGSTSRVDAWLSEPSESSLEALLKGVPEGTLKLAIEDYERVAPIKFAEAAGFELQYPDVEQERADVVAGLMQLYKGRKDIANWIDSNYPTLAAALNYPISGPPKSKRILTALYSDPPQGLDLQQLKQRSLAALGVSLLETARLAKPYYAAGEVVVVQGGPEDYKAAIRARFNWVYNHLSVMESQTEPKTWTLFFS